MHERELRFAITAMYLYLLSFTYFAYIFLTGALFWPRELGEKPKDAQCSCHGKRNYTFCIC